MIWYLNKVLDRPTQMHDKLSKPMVVTALKSSQTMISQNYNVYRRIPTIRTPVIQVANYSDRFEHKVFMFEINESNATIL